MCRQFHSLSKEMKAVGKINLCRNDCVEHSVNWVRERKRGIGPRTDVLDVKYQGRGGIMKMRLMNWCESVISILSVSDDAFFRHLLQCNV